MITSSVLHRHERGLHFARFEARRIQNDLLAGLLELLDVVADDAAILDIEHTWLSPFAAIAELDIADHGVEAHAADIVGELLIICRANRVNRRLENLQLRIGKGWDVYPERINTGLRRALPVSH